MTPFVRAFWFVVLPAGVVSAADRETYDALKEDAWKPVGEIRLETTGAAPVADLSDEAIALGGNALSLGLLLEQVQRRNPSLDEALNSWRAALARYPQEKALDDPMLSYNVAPLTLDRARVSEGNTTRQFSLTPGSLPTAAFQRTDRSGRTFGITTGRPPTFRFSDSDTERRLDQGHVVEISQKFPWPGKRRLRGEMALQEAAGARLDLEAVRQQLLLETKLSFYEYWYVHQAMEINAINLGLLEEFQEIAESKYAAGVATIQDALQAEVEREHLAHQDVVLTRIRNVTRARINTLLNRSPGKDLPAPPEEVGRIMPMPDLDLLQHIALSNRPELHALATRIEAKETGVALAQREFYPDITVMSEYNSMWREDEHRWMIGAAINVPIQLGRRRAAVDEARAEALRLEADLAGEAAKVALAVHEAFEELNENHHVVELYTGRLLPAAEENLEAAEAGYASGEVDFLALITAQKLLMDTELKLEEALASYHQSKADLERAIAGPVEPLLAFAESPE